MKKPESGEVQAGWYESPEHVGYEQYWNGKYWDKNLRLPPDFEGSLPVDEALVLGKMYFRKPYFSDDAFQVVFGLTSVVQVARIYTNAKEGSFDSSTAYSIFSGLGDAILGVFLTFLFSWLIALFYLVPRRKKDLLRIASSTQLGDINKSQNQVLPLGRFFTRRKFISAGVVIIFLIVPFFNLISSGKNSEDKYFEIEQKISAVVGEWNVSATPISKAIQGITAGTTDEGTARTVASSASSRFAVITYELEDACKPIPIFDVNSSGKEGALAKAYYALKVTCDLLPSESAEVLLLLEAQLNPTSTQTELDYHVGQISDIIGKRKQAMLESVNALEPYASAAQKDALNRMKSLLG